MLKSYYCLAMLTGIAIAAGSCVYSHTDNNKTSGTANTLLEVAAYETVPFDSVEIVITDTAAVEGLLPLRYNYTTEEVEKMTQLLEQNDSSLNAQGLKYQWMENDESEKTNLVIFHQTPVLNQAVKVTDVKRLQGYDDTLTVTLLFRNKKQWERITSANIGKRLVMEFNREILYDPWISMPITEGECWLSLPASKGQTLLPDVDFSNLK